MFQFPRPLWLAAGVALAALLVTLPALRGPFIFDDVALIPGNHYVHDLAHHREWFTRSLWDTNYDVAVDQHRTFWRPLVVASYAIDWQLGGGSPLAFHVTNALLHAVNTALAFYLLLGWARSRGAAAFGALLFGLHPAQTEVASWIAGRTDALCLLGLSIATLSFRAGPRPRAAGLALRVLGLGIAFLSKEAAVVFPLLAAIELWMQGERSLDRSTLTRTARAVAPYAALAVAFAVAHRLLTSDAQPPPALGAWRHASLVLEAYGRYTALLLWPDDLTFGRALLTFEGSFPQVRPEYAALGGLLLGGVTLAAWRLRKRRAALSVTLAAWPLLLLPVSGLVWLNYAVLVSPRFLYVPMLGAAAAAAFVPALLPAPRLRRAGVLAGLSLVALGSRAWARSLDFASTEAFWRRELSHNPLYTAAQEYFVSRELQAGRPRSALTLAGHFLQQGSVHGAPNRQRSTLLIKLLASALTATRDVDHERLHAIQKFALSVLSRDPVLLELPGIRVDIRKDARLVEQLLESDRTLHIIAAEAAERLGDDALARSEVERALSGCADCWTLLSTSALILARCGDLERALELAERATRLSPPGQLAGLVEMIQTGARWRARAREQPSPINRAGFHVALGSFGRAHALAEAAFAEPPSDPSSLLPLAELAYQAGDVSTAERLLARGFGSEGAARALAAFASKARWRDRPRPADVWMPDVAP